MKKFILFLLFFLFILIKIMRKGKKVKIFVINLDKDTDRYLTIEKSLKEINCEFERVSGIEYIKLQNVQNLENIIYPINNLIGKEFECLESNDKWIYDGTLYKSFPGLHLNGHFGTKGLTLSNLKVFNKIESMDENYDWYCILEDDAEINEKNYSQILQFINKIFNNFDIILLDVRDNGEGGCAGVMYSKRIISQIKIDLHPLSQFSIENERKYKYKKGTNLWDWKLMSYIKNKNIKVGRLPIINSGKFVSTINHIKIEDRDK